MSAHRQPPLAAPSSSHSSSSHSSSSSLFFFFMAGDSPIVHALLGTLFTWAVTAAGAAVVFVASPSQRFLDGSLGFAAGG
jgi:hypothetical protein